MHNFVIGSLDHSRLGFDVACWHFKKSFFWRLQELLNQEVFSEVWNQVFAFKWICNVIGVTWDTLNCFVAKLWHDREVLKAKLMPLDAKIIFWVENDVSEASKSGKNGTNFQMTRGIIFEKINFFSFSFIKRWFWSRGML